MQSPLVTIIIPLFNHGQYIEDTLSSVLKQTYPYLEIIVIDDGSTDNSADLVKSFSDPRIRYIYQENRGAHFTINRGIELAAGEYVAVLNSDDMYHPRRIETFLDYCRVHGNIDALFSYVQCIDEKNISLHLIEGVKENWKGRDPGMNFVESDDIFLQLLGGNFLCTTSNLFCRRSVFADIGGFTGLRYTHDYAFFLKLSYHKKTALVQEPLLDYRIHDKNTLKESQTNVFIEVSLVLTNVLAEYDLTKYFSRYGTEEFLARLLWSVQFYETEQFAFVLLLARLKYDQENMLFQKLVENPDHLLRVEEGKKRDEEREKKAALIGVMENRSEACEQLKSHKEELEMTIQTILGSKSYRLARVISWPLRRAAAAFNFVITFLRV